MVETLSSGGRWNVALARTDLIEKAGLNENDLTWEVTHLKYKGRRMRISHIYTNTLSLAWKEKRMTISKR